MGNSSDAGQADQYFVVSQVNGPGAADILLVGGGGGGGYKGGGGGAGQVVTASITLTAQTYIAKVGAGGAGDMPTGPRWYRCKNLVIVLEQQQHSDHQVLKVNLVQVVEEKCGSDSATDPAKNGDNGYQDGSGGGVNLV